MVNRVPILQAGPCLDLALPEGSLRVATIVAQDADGDTLTYAIAGGPDAERFRLTSGNVLEFIAPPDYEAPTDHDGDNIYRLDIIARDGRDLSDPFSALDLATWWRADWSRHDVFNNDWSPKETLNKY